MNYKENIAYRQLLNQKVCNGYRCTKEEKLWFQVNPMYNPRYDEPRYQRDLIQLKPKQLYQIKVKIELLNHDLMRMIPLIGVAAGKGEIVTVNPLFDIDEKQTEKYSTKLLGVLIDNDRPESQFTVKSQLGLVSVAYQCDYFDPYMKLEKRECSDGVNRLFAMNRKDISSNQVLYECKSPLKEDFDALVFSIEWNES